MLELCFLLGFVSILAAYLVNKYLEQRQQEITHKIALNNTAVNDALSAATLELVNKEIESRMSQLRLELDAIKLSFGLKNAR